MDGRRDGQINRQTDGRGATFNVVPWEGHTKSD